MPVPFGLHVRWFRGGLVIKAHNFRVLTGNVERLTFAKSVSLKLQNSGRGPTSVSRPSPSPPGARSRPNLPFPRTTRPPSHQPPCLLICARPAPGSPRGFQGTHPAGFGKGSWPLRAPLPCQAVFGDTGGSPPPVARCRVARDRFAVARGALGP
jgi:hypothetical protein